MHSTKTGYCMCQGMAGLALGVSRSTAHTALFGSTQHITVSLVPKHSKNNGSEIKFYVFNKKNKI